MKCMQTIACFASLVISLSLGANAFAADENAADAVPAYTQSSASEVAPKINKKNSVALGFTLDLLPVVMSATAGEFGMTGQVWMGVDHVRVRLVGGRFSSPDWLAAKDGFTDQQTAVAALLVDYCFGEHFDGWWIGTGFENWWISMQHDTQPGTARWSTLVWTLGGGYIWRFWGNLYLNPWAAVHVPINNYDVALGNAVYSPMPILGEVSLKFGWFIDL